MRIHYCRLTVLILAAMLTQASPGFAAGPGMRGQVLGLDAKGVPVGVVASAKIEFINRAGKVAATATSDRKGAYQVNLPPGTYTFRVQAAGFKDEDAGRAITLTLGEGYALQNFSLIRGKTAANAKAPSTEKVAVGVLTGRVRAKGPDGKLIDVPGAVISMRKAGGKQVVKTTTRSDDAKARGEYTISLDAGSYQIAVAAHGFATLVVADAETIAGGKTQTRDFVLTPAKAADTTGQGIKGTIKFAGDKTSSNVKVSIRPLPSGTAASTLRPDDKGAYQHDLPTGRYGVVVEADGFKTFSSQPSYVLAGKYTIVNVRLLPQGIPVVVTIHEAPSSDKAGKKAIAGATVVLRKQGDPLTGAPRGTTGPDGKVTLTASSPGQYQILTRINGYKTSTTSIEVASQAKHVEISLTKDTSLVALHLHVQDGKDKTGIPIAAAKISIGQDGKILQSATTDAKGDHTFSLAPGTYHLEVSHAGYAVDKIDVTLGKEEVRREIVLRAIAQAKLKLHVVERSKTGAKAIAGAEIVISQKVKVATGKSDQDGRFAVALPPGTYAVNVSKAGFKTAAIQVNVAAAEVDREVDLEPMPMGPSDKKSLHLHVIQQVKGSDSPVAGADITVSQKGKQISEGKSGPDGKLTMLLSPGNYSVHVVKQGFKASNTTVDIAKQDVTKDIHLEIDAAVPRKATLTVHVIERTKAGDKTIDTAIADADVVINQSGKHAAAGKSGPDGKFAAPLPPGTCMVTVTKTGFTPVTITLDIMQDTARDVPLTRTLKK